MTTLKVLTNEKRGGLTAVTFDVSRIKLFAPRLSDKSMLTPSCERAKTAQRTLFPLFEHNNCLQTRHQYSGLRHSFYIIVFSETALL
jgi:hypothetical protein